MKTRNFAWTIALGLLVSMSACKKENADPKDSAELDPKVSQFNSDANNYKSESDQADQDINNALSDIPAFGRVSSAAKAFSSPLCGATIDSSQIANKILFFNFDGVTPCFSPSRTRSGQIKVELTSGNRWSDAGSVLTLTYTNFKVTRLSNNRSIMFNGVKTLKNINGNNWIAFFTSTASLKYQERAYNVAVSFDSVYSSTWNSARITQWNYVQAGVNPNIPYNHITFSASGDTTLNGQVNTDSWGLNRYGDAFVTHYNSPIVSNTYCGLWRFTSGELVHHVNSSVFTLTLGVDQGGNPTPYTCAYGYMVSWIVGSNANSIVLSY
jgi:hypothetical protein